MLQKFVASAVVLGVLGTGIVGWHEMVVKREVEECSREWRRKLTTANAVAQAEIAKAQEQASASQAELEVKSRTFEEKINAFEAKLVEQRAATPPSEACNLCRIPAQRVLPSGNPNRGDNLDRKSQAGGQEAVDTSEKREVPRTGKK